MPKKIEWIIKKMAESIPKVLKRFLLSNCCKLLINLLVFTQYKINKKDENIIEGLNIRYVGYVLAVLLIETPPSKYGKVGFDLPI